MSKKKMSGLGRGHCEFLSAFKSNPGGGTIINIIAVLIIVGLIGFGVMWVFKTAGDMGQQYTDAMVDTKLKAVDVKCQMNLRTIGQNLQMYVISNGSFPESQEELEQWCGGSRLFQCPDPNGPKYIYIPGQNANCPGNNIMVYEPEAIHDGRCNVLLLDGQVGWLDPEELKAAVLQTLASLRK